MSGIPEPIRVWLEPGYDGGRFGAWMLDQPGCFVWGRDRDVALARVASGLGAFGAWMAGHGEPISITETHEAAVVEEVPASVVGGHERNATFEADRSAVDTARLAATLRRLEYARANLENAIERLGDRSLEAAALGALSSGRQERTGGEIVRHVAGTEVWLVGRLDPSSRYAGVDPDGALEPFLAASHDWALAEVRRIQAADPGIELTDRHGETWTLAKVLRRLVYHSLDHYGELDRRIARADGAAERLPIRRDVLIEPAQLGALFRSVGWYRLVREPGRLARLIEGSTQIVSAWDGERLVGFARAMSDDAAYGLISTVAVHPAWQGKGLGRRLMLALLENNDAIRFALSAVPGAEQLYASVGFVRDERAMVRRRRH